MPVLELVSDSAGNSYNSEASPALFEGAGAIICPHFEILYSNYVESSSNSEMW
jgi:hypothetical protein